MAANEGVTKAIASFYYDDSDTVFLDLFYDLRPNIIPGNFFLSNMREIFTLSWPGVPETSLLLPKIPDDFPKTSELLSTSEAT